MRTVYGFTGTVVILDQLTKFLAVQFLQPIDSVAVIPNFFYLSFIQNTGIAFGLFHNYPTAWMLIITASVILLAIFSFHFKQQSYAQRMAYGFILGGAIGNWIDRIRIQSVIDFFDFRIWPVFNVADTFITIGVALFVLFTFGSDHHVSNRS